MKIEARLLGLVVVPILLAGLFGGCSLLAGPAPTPTPALTPTATHTPPPATTSTPTPSPFPTSTSTDTPQPTATPTEPPTSTPTPVPPTATHTLASTSTPLPPTATSTPIPTEPPPSPTLTPPSVISGWRGEYYGNRHLAGDPALVRDDPNVDFNWRQGAPVSDLPTDAFSVRWTRDVAFDEGAYRFHAVVDDGVRVYVDGELVINEWRDGSRREVTGEYELATGKHSLRIEYYERVGDAVIQVWWERLGPMFPDWHAEYWPNQFLYGDPVVTRNDPAIDFDWGGGAPVKELPSDGFSVRWTNTAPFEAGTYRFHLVVDDGAALWFDERTIINEWRDGEVREVTAQVAVADGRHSLRVEYYERTGAAVIRVWWEKISGGPVPD